MTKYKLMKVTIQTQKNTPCGAGKPTSQVATEILNKIFWCTHK